MSTLWVFGYGSLIWNPGFDYDHSKVGKIRGYSRKFWQGSDVHRGSPHRLGRVVTLIEEEGAVTWGRAFQFTDEASTLAYLGNRESSIGGYSSFIAQFEPRDPKEDPFPVLVYIALPSNPLFVGAAPVDQMANDIALSKGQCGYNVEYLANLAAFMHLHVPEVWDEHLFSLEKSVCTILTQSKPKLLSLFDKAYAHDLESNVKYTHVTELNDKLTNSDTSSDESNSPSPSLLSTTPSKYTDTVPSRKLRCLNK